MTISFERYEKLHVQGFTRTNAFVRNKSSFETIYIIFQDLIHYILHSPQSSCDVKLFFILFKFFFLVFLFSC